MSLMPAAPVVRIARIEHGLWEQASALNPRIDPDRPILRAALRIDWSPPDPHGAVRGLEMSLLAFSPGFVAHECRGPDSYHVFRGAEGSTMSGNSFEPELALAHLIEHAVIDFQCGMTGRRRCSGVTGALRDPPGAYDLIVECDDARPGRCSLALAVRWLTAAAAGKPPGDREKDILAAAGLAWSGRGGALRPEGVAHALVWTLERAARALSALCDAGFLEQISPAMNFGGVSEYRVPAA